MIKKELKLMLGGGLVDVELDDEAYALAIKLAEEEYPYNDEPIKHRRLAFAECLTMIGIAHAKFPDNTIGINNGKTYLELAKYWRETLIRN